MDWFLTKDSLEIVREGFEKGGNFTSDAPHEIEQPSPLAPGRIRIEDDSLIYAISGEVFWQVPIAEIRVIGEYTDESGPGADDYFLTFLTATEFFEVSFQAEGRDAVLAQLGQRLGHPLVTGLTDSTGLASRILWPARLEGEAVFDFVPQGPKPERRLTDKLLEELEVR